MVVHVDVKDESGANPIACEMVWAWTPKVRAPRAKDTSGSAQNKQEQ